MIVCELAPSVPGFYVIPRQWKRRQRKGRVKMNSNSEEGARMAVRRADGADGGSYHKVRNHALA